MGLSIGPRIEVEGAEKFQLAFKEMAASAGMLQSQMDAVTASFRENDSAMKTNKAVAEQLTKQISDQQRIYDASVEGYQKAKQAVYDSAKAIEQSKKEYEAATPVLQIFTAQYQESINIQQRQEQVVADVNERLQEAIGVRDSLKQKFEEGQEALQNEVNLHKQLIADGSELVTTYNNTKTAYEEAAKALAKNVNETTRSEERHRTYEAQIEASRQRIVQLKDQHEYLTTAVKYYEGEVARATEAAKQEKAEFGQNSEQAKVARAERDALTATLKDYKKELSSVTTAINREEKALDDLQQKDASVVNRTRELESAHDGLDKTMKQTEQEFKNASEALDEEKVATQNAQKELEEYRKQHNKNSEERKAARQTVADLRKELQSEEKELAENKKETEAHRKALGEAKKEYKALNDAIASAEKRLDVARIAVQKWGDVMYTAKAKLEEFKKQLEDLPKKLESFSEDCIKSGEALSEIGTGLTKILSPFTALSAYGVKSAMTFTDALAKISTIADTSLVSLEEYGDGIVEIANATGFATSDIAAATYQALSAAVKTEDSLEFVAGAADLARAGFLDMFGSVDVLTTILNAYHKDVSDVSHISDVLVKVQDRGKQYLFVFNAKNRYTPFTLATA